MCCRTQENCQILGGNEENLAIFFLFNGYFLDKNFSFMASESGMIFFMEDIFNNISQNNEYSAKYISTKLIYVRTGTPILTGFALTVHGK